MSNDLREPNPENHGYVCHCRKCGGVVAMVTATAEDLPTVLAEWASMENTYLERYRIQVIRKLQFCEHST